MDDEIIDFGHTKNVKIQFNSPYMLRHSLAKYKFIHFIAPVRIKARFELMPGNVCACENYNINANSPTYCVFHKFFGFPLDLVCI